MFLVDLYLFIRIKERCLSLKCWFETMQGYDHVEKLWYFCSLSRHNICPILSLIANLFSLVCSSVLVLNDIFLLNFSSDQISCLFITLP